MPQKKNQPRTLGQLARPTSYHAAWARVKVAITPRRRAGVPDPSVQAVPLPSRRVTKVTATQREYGGNPADVRFGSKADMCSATRDVRFVPKADFSASFQLWDCPYPRSLRRAP